MNNAFLIYVFCQLFIEEVLIYHHQILTMMTQLHRPVHPPQYQRKGQKGNVSSYFDFW